MDYFFAFTHHNLWVLVCVCVFYHFTARFCTSPFLSSSSLSSMVTTFLSLSSSSLMLSFCSSSIRSLVAMNLVTHTHTHKRTSGDTGRDSLDELRVKNKETGGKNLQITWLMNCAGMNYEWQCCGKYPDVIKSKDIVLNITLVKVKVTHTKSTRVKVWHDLILNISMYQKHT